MKIDKFNEKFEDFIKNKSKEISEDFFNIYKFGIIKQYDYEIDADKLNSNFSESIDITQNSYFSKMFEELKMYEKYPALYYFQINSKIEYNKIVTSIETLRKEFRLSIPVFNKNKVNNGFLYVGKVKECAWGRLIQHLGYHKNRKSHGLQIDFWANEFDYPLELNYSVIFLNQGISEYLTVLEIELANKMNPILGRYKY